MAEIKEKRRREQEENVARRKAEKEGKGSRRKPRGERMNVDGEEERGSEEERESEEESDVDEEEMLLALENEMQG